MHSKHCIIHNLQGRYLRSPSDCELTQDSDRKNAHNLGYMEQQPTIGLLGPGWLQMDGRLHRSGMRFPTLWHVFLRALFLDSLFRGSRFFGGFLMKDFHFDRTTDIDVLNGWFWIARREALNQVGPLDERFFMYGEDLRSEERRVGE